MARLPEPSCHRISPRLSSATIAQLDGTVPKLAVARTLPPSMNQTTTAPVALSRQSRSPLPSPLRSPVPWTDQLFGTLPTPTAEETCVPFMNQKIAAGITPENIGVAVAVEISLADDRPIGRNGADGRALDDLRAIHRPDGDGKGRRRS